MARNSTEPLVASTIWSRENPLFPAHGVNRTLPSIYKCGNMLILKGVVCSGGPLHSCTILEYLTYSFVPSSRNMFWLHGRIEGIRKKVASLNPAHSFVICIECAFREGCPQELPLSPRCLQRVLDLRRVISLLIIRPLEYYSGQICIAALRINQYKIVMPRGSSFISLDCRLCD